MSARYTYWCPQCESPAVRLEDISYGDGTDGELFHCRCCGWSALGEDVGHSMQPFDTQDEGQRATLQRLQRDRA